ncbi:MAG: tRNA pseudouridine(38-40) synthase TruA [Promethearchaeota archaeon]
MEQRRYLFKFYYIGSKKFHGSQRQPNLITIEDCLLNALYRKKYIKDIKASGFEVSSRTDRFVSARGAVFSFNSLKKPILMEINSELPKEIGIWAHTEVPIDFLSRYNAIYRHYKYIVPEPLSFLKKNNRFNLNVIKKACKELEGKHNFINFSKRNRDEKKTIRDIDSVKMTINNDFIIFDFKSKAFLREQIRRMVKKILELGKGKIDYDEFLELFDEIKYFSYQPADPAGLILWNIKFEDSIQFEVDIKSKKKMVTYFLNQKLKFGYKAQLFKILYEND